MVPTSTLPLVQLIPSLKKCEAEPKAKIDKGYSRNDTATATATATAKDFHHVIAPRARHSAPLSE